MERVCNSCGADPGQGSFCQHCGTQVGAAPDPAATPPANPAPNPVAPPPPQQMPPQQMPPQQMPPQAPPKKSGFLKGCLFFGIIGLLVLAVGGYFGWRFINDEILPGIEETTDAFNTTSDAPPGPCYDIDVEDGFLVGWTEVTCNGPRQVEVSFAAAFEEGPFPGDQYLNQQAENTCRESFEAYVGISPEDSIYGADWLVPTEVTWAEGARQGICLVVADDGSALTGTVKESES